MARIRSRHSCCQGGLELMYMQTCSFSKKRQFNLCVASAKPIRITTTAIQNQKYRRQLPDQRPSVCVATQRLWCAHRDASAPGGAFSVSITRSQRRGLCLWRSKEWNWKFWNPTTGIVFALVSSRLNGLNLCQSKRRSQVTCLVFFSSKNMTSYPGHRQR